MLTDTILSIIFNTIFHQCCQALLVLVAVSTKTMAANTLKLQYQYVNVSVIGYRFVTDIIVIL